MALDKCETIRQWKSKVGGHVHGKDDAEEVDINYYPSAGIVKILAKTEKGEFFWCYFDFRTFRYGRNNRIESNSLDYVSIGATKYKTEKAAMKNF